MKLVTLVKRSASLSWRGISPQLIGRAVFRQSLHTSVAAMLLRGTCVALPLALGACGEQSQEEEAGLVVRVDTVGPVVHVRNAGRAPLWSLRPILTVGSEASIGQPSDDEFGWVNSVGLSPAGDLFVADQFDHEIKVFGLDGRLRMRIGREGQGPGEFRSLYSLAWVGTTLLVLDMRNRRIAEIGPDGSWLGQREASGGSGSPSMIRFYAVSSTEVYAWSLRPEPTGVRRVFIRHGTSGVEAEILQATGPDGPSSYIICERPDGGITFLDIPFAPQFLQHPAPGNQIAVAWTAVYRIAFLSSEGDTVRIVERDHDPVPLTPDEWDAALGEFRSFRAEWPGASCQPRSPSKPDVKPAVRDLLIDLEGRLWVEATTTQGNMWEIFDRDGVLIGSLPSFARSRRVPPYLAKDRVAYVSEDSLGVQRVEVAEFGSQR